MSQASRRRSALPWRGGCSRWTEVSTYVETSARFARYFDRSPGRLGPEQIRAYQVYLTNERRLAPSSLVVAVSALRFLERAALEASREDFLRDNPRIDPAQTCRAQPAGSGCWKELANQQGCYVWNPYPKPGETATWTGACADGVARGSGTLSLNTSDGTDTGTGALQGGRSHGNWTWRYPSGLVFEGAHVNGERHGNVVLRFPSGNVFEGAHVNGEFHGNAVMRYASGLVEHRRYVNGEEPGNRVQRFPDGNVAEGRVDNGGRRQGHWVWRFSAGQVEEGPYVNGQRQGHWVERDPYATVESTGPNSYHLTGYPLMEGPYVNGERHGHWVEHNPDGSVQEGSYANGQRTGSWTLRFQDGRVQSCRVGPNQSMKCSGDGFSVLPGGPGGRQGGRPASRGGCQADPRCHGNR